jgi:flagellar basal body-associated protein FliL
MTRADAGHFEPHAQRSLKIMTLLAFGLPQGPEILILFLILVFLGLPIITVGLIVFVILSRQKKKEGENPSQNQDSKA